MNYKIWLHTSGYRRVELFNNLVLDNFQETVIGEEYKIYKDDMHNILIQYQKFIKNISKEEHSRYCAVLPYAVSYYFSDLLDDDLLITTSNYFLLQYFYLVDLYREMNEETFYKITCG